MAISKDTSLNMLRWFKEALDEDIDAKIATLSGGGGQNNVIENISIDGKIQSIDANKTAQLDLSTYAKKTDVASAVSTITGGTTIISGESYELQPATKTELGGVIVGNGLDVTDDGTLSVTLETGQDNVIENIFINGENQPVTNKTAQLDLSAYAKKTDIAGSINSLALGDENVIEAIWVDGTPQPVENKIAKLELNAYAKKSDVASGMNVKGSVNYFADLPINAEIGDLYNVKNAGGVDGEGVEIQAGDNVVFTADGKWDVMAGLIDLSGYVEKVKGKQLSTEDFTTALKTKLEGLNNYELPTASETQKGGAMIGDGLSMDGDTLNVTLESYTLPPATASELGGIIVGDGFEVENDGTLNCTVKGEIYSEFTGATSIAGGEKGLVPAPKSGDQKNFLCGDGTWADPSRFVHVVIGGGGSATASSSSVSTIQGGLWQDLIDGVPVLKLRYGDYEYNFNYDTASRTGDGTIPLDTTTKGVEYVLTTVPSSQDGQLWYEVTDNHPTLMVHKWVFNYGYNYDTITYKGSNANLWSYLPFESTTADALGNITWTKTDTPTIETSPLGGKALRNTGGLKRELTSFTGAFTIDFWLYIDLDEFPSNDNVNYDIFIATLSNATVKLSVKNRILSCTGAGTFEILNASKKRTHFALTRKAGNVNAQKSTLVYVDGKYQGTTKAGLYFSLVQIFPTASTDYPAYIDHFRFFKGQVVWGGDFTPPVAEDYLK